MNISAEKAFYFCMKGFGWKRLLLIGFVVVLLIAIPVSLYLLQQQTQKNTHATKSTVLSFTPNSTAAAPIQGTVGQAVPLHIRVDPGTNSVSYVKLIIQYDPTQLTATTGALTVTNPNFSPIQGPDFQPGEIAVSLSIGSDVTKAITSPAELAVVNLTPLAATNANNPASVTFSTDTDVRSVAGPPKSNDQFAENVLSSTQPAFITVAAAGTPTGTPTPTTAAGQPTSTPTPTTAQAAPTATPTTAAVATPTDTPVPAVATDTPAVSGGVPADTDTPSPTMANTGSTEVTFGVGAILTVLLVAGGIIFFII